MEGSWERRKVRVGMIRPVIQIGMKCPPCISKKQKNKYLHYSPCLSSLPSSSSLSLPPFPPLHLFHTLSLFRLLFAAFWIAISSSERGFNLSSIKANTCADMSSNARAASIISRLSRISIFRSSLFLDEE